MSLQELRQVIIDARQRFIRDAEIVTRDADTETVAFAVSLTNAIGEVSPDEALEALRKFKAERQAGWTA